MKYITKPLAAFVILASSALAKELPTVLVIGQSNAVGRSTTLQTLDKDYHTLTNVTHFKHANATAAYQLNKIPFTTQGKWTETLSAKSDHIGPEFGFLKQYKQPVGLIKFAVGGTNLANQSC